MDDGGLSPLICSLLLILFADYIAVCETALASVSKVRMKTLADHGNKRAEKVLSALENFDRTISTLLVCTNIAHLATAALVTVWVTRKFGLSAVSVSTLITSLLVFFFAEMLPKSIAKKYAEKCALGCISSLEIFITLFRPVSALLAVIGQWAGRLTKAEEEISVTEEEIYDIIEDMTEEGSLDEEQGDLITSAMQFSDVTVENVLTPRVDVLAIDIKDSREEILTQIKECNHSRLPVYEGSIDNVIGVLRIRAFIRAYLKDKEQADVRSLLDDPVFVAESAPVNEVLNIMSRNRANLAIVTDHYGGTVGIVTIEDILESLVGEIWDEDDVVEDPIVNQGDGRFFVDAEETVGDTFDEMEFDFPSPEEEDEHGSKRVGEWVYEQFAAIPRPRDSFEYNGLLVIVAKMEHNRIRKVVMQLPPKTEEGGEDA
ncbi:MAG: HlyC/CorC family transporter [Lachnospiraceae bacterium]|nr:HlyC/CorC family transporter [Lachnospiraceae bacterium]